MEPVAARLQRGVAVMIFWHLDDQGGFTAGDTETGLTAYAYPTSPSATSARRDPRRIAAMLVANEDPLWRTIAPGVARYDAENWARMGVPA